MITTFPKLFIILCIAAPGVDHSTTVPDELREAFLQLPQCSLLDKEIESFYESIDLETQKVSWIDNVLWLRSYMRGYNDTPPSADIHRLPSLEACKAKLEFADKIKEKVQDQLAICSFWNNEEGKLKLYEIQEEIRVASMATQWLVMVHESNNKNYIRIQLELIRSEIGFEAYYQGQLPNPVPFNLFKENYEN